MNAKLKEIVNSAIVALKSSLLSAQKTIVLAEFTKIYNGEVSASESWNNLLKGGFDVSLRDPFHNIGYLISIPKTGASNILREAYAAYLNDFGASEVQGKVFLEDQSDVREEVFNLLDNLTSS